MFPQEMLVADTVRRGAGLRIYELGEYAHFRHFFQNNGVVNRLGRVTPPGEGAVIAADDRGNIAGVNAPTAEGLDRKSVV